MKIAILHGPNLNRLGHRNPAKYGDATLTDITDDVDAAARTLGATTVHFQSNHEGALVDRVHEWHHDVAGVILNPAGLSPTGYSLLDAINDTAHPFAVVHISQWHASDGKERRDVFASSARLHRRRGLAGLRTRSGRTGAQDPR
jgi:3-dehydroquinate dehydratase-2